MIHDVIRSGGHFAVNMQNGDLTIIRQNGSVDCVPMDKFKIMFTCKNGDFVVARKSITDILNSVQQMINMWNLDRATFTVYDGQYPTVVHWSSDVKLQAQFLFDCRRLLQSLNFVD